MEVIGIEFAQQKDMNNRAFLKKIITGRIESTITKCTECNNDTYQRDSICVICKTGITQMYMELMELIKKQELNTDS